MFENSADSGNSAMAVNFPACRGRAGEQQVFAVPASEEHPIEWQLVVFGWCSSLMSPEGCKYSRKQALIGDLQSQNGNSAWTSGGQQAYGIIGIAGHGAAGQQSQGEGTGETAVV